MPFVISLTSLSHPRTTRIRSLSTCKPFQRPRQSDKDILKTTFIAGPKHWTNAQNEMKTKRIRDGRAPKKRENNNRDVVMIFNFKPHCQRPKLIKHYFNYGNSISHKNHRCHEAVDSNKFQSMDRRDSSTRISNGSLDPGVPILTMDGGGTTTGRSSQVNYQGTIRSSPKPAKDRRESRTSPIRSSRLRLEGDASRAKCWSSTAVLLGPQVIVVKYFNVFQHIPLNR